ncbi:MAG: hypothetical protein M1598_01230, partial [Actinobacteria bacterium]|nr:hypothetical protein [Actinomycetota bacterium]
EREFHVPESMAKIPLVQEVMDNKAAAGILEVGGKKVGIQRAYMGLFDNGSEKAVLRYVIVRNHGSAQELLENLRAGMVAAKKYDPPVDERIGNGGFMTRGDGMEQVVFTTENMVYWVSLKTPRVDEVINWILKHNFRKGNY